MSDAPTERERWEADKAFRERELLVKERELDIDHRQRRWYRDPLVLGVFGAIAALVGNLIVSVVNGTNERSLAQQQGESELLQQMIVTGNDPDQAAENIAFVLSAGLITNRELADRLKAFLAARDPGTGPALSTERGKAQVEMLDMLPELWPYLEALGDEP